MAFGLLILVLLVASAGALAALIVAIVLACKRLWPAALASLGIMVVCGGLAVGSIVGLVVKTVRTVSVAVAQAHSAFGVRIAIRLAPRSAR